MFNADRIFAHRGLILTALKVYEAAVKRVIKGEAEVEADTSDCEAKLQVIEILRGEFVDQKSMNLEGTPLGDMIGEHTMRDEDGTVLTADKIEGYLRVVGIDAPFDHIGMWTLDQRKLVNAYRKARELFLLGEAPEPPLLDIISADWFKGGVLEMPLEEDEIEAAVGGGPFTLRPDPNAVSPGEAEWQVVGVDEGGDVAVHSAYGQLDRARLICANLNLIERGRRLRAENAAVGAATAELIEKARDGAPDEKIQDFLDDLGSGKSGAPNEAAAAVEDGQRKKKRMTHHRAPPKEK